MKRRMLRSPLPHPPHTSPPCCADLTAAGQGLCCAVQSTAGLKLDQAHRPWLEVRYSRHPVAVMMHTGSGRVMFHLGKGSQRGRRSDTASPRLAAAAPPGVARQLTSRHWRGDSATPSQLPHAPASVGACTRLVKFRTSHGSAPLCLALAPRSTREQVQARIRRAYGTHLPHRCRAGGCRTARCSWSTRHR